jgi:plastocyanin
MRRLTVITLALTAGLVFAVPASASIGTIFAIDDFEYIPTTKTAPAVATSFYLQFDNGGSFAHTATSDDGLFDTGQIASGASAVEHVYGSGTYDFHCENHAQMVGTVKIRPVASDRNITVGESIELRVGADFLKGVVFDVQRSRNGGDWLNVRVDTFDATPTFTLNKEGIYEFRARTQFFKGDHSKWSPVRKVVVDAA